jgi:LmbE family N-acetylglucosaminyl deacetylase
MNIAVIAAHPDDEVLGCGATMAKLASQGANIEVLIMAEGITSRSDTRNALTSQGKLAELSEASKKANACVGVSSVTQLSFPDNRLDSVDLLDLVKGVEKFLDGTEWDRIYTHFGNDLNIDHRYVHEAVVTACRPMPGDKTPELLFFETQSSTEWRAPQIVAGFSPTVYEDVTPYLKNKSTALAEYESEMRPWPHARSIKAVEHLAHWRGSTIGVEAAEAFQLGRIIR